jgi:arginine N-succinyltransferase
VTGWHARFLLRPAVAADLGGLERLAAASAIGISSLPAEREALRERIARSQRSFADDAEPDAHYLFVLEDRAAGGALVGTAGIAASAGGGDPFYSYRSAYSVHASPALGVRRRVHTLQLDPALSGATLLTGFHIDPELEQGPAAELLSRGRLLFIASFPERFGDRIVSEHPGLADESGRCPFWDAVGRRFLNLDYPAAERLAAGRGKAFLADLLPPSPIHVPLLDEATQWAIGQLHPVAERPFQILLDEGFEADTWLNVFDGGPTLEGRLPLLRTARRLRGVGVLPPAPPGGRHAGTLHLAASRHRAGWRATLLHLDATAPAVALDDGAAVLLGLQAGDTLQVASIDGGEVRP